VPEYERVVTATYAHFFSRFFVFVLLANKGVFVLTYCTALLNVALLLNNQPEALIIQMYSVIKLYTFRASTLPIIRSFPL
jgi:hypothetical protein